MVCLGKSVDSLFLISIVAFCRFCRVILYFDAATQLMKRDFVFFFLD